MSKQRDRTITVSYWNQSAQENACQFVQGVSWDFEDDWLTITNARGDVVAQFREDDVYTIV